MSQCYPEEGVAWLKSGNWQARDYLARLIGQWYGSRVERVVDCRPIPKARISTEVPYGHLGYHPANIAACLNEPDIREWRFTRYIELLYLFGSRAMTPNDGTELASVYVCRQGKHRSVMWSAIENAIINGLGGISCREVPVCYAAQKQTRCQKRGCDQCDPLSADVQALTQAAVDEFHAVALCVDAVFEAEVCEA